MKRAAFHMTFALLVASVASLSSAAAVTENAVPEPTAAAEYQSPVYNHCIHEFYDPEMYNWFSFENRCGEALSVTFVATNAGFGGARSTTSGPGGKPTRAIRAKTFGARAATNCTYARLASSPSTRTIST